MKSTALHGYLGLVGQGIPNPPKSQSIPVDILNSSAPKVVKSETKPCPARWRNMNSSQFKRYAKLQKAYQDQLNGKR